MKGNDKIAFTAEAIALMRAEKGTDKYSQYFVSEDIKKKFRRISRVAPKRLLDKIFVKRIRLSFELDKIIRDYRPTQIVELACGYSPRGLILTQKNPKIAYIETDFSSVIEKKQEIINSLVKMGKVKKRKNHHLVPLDSLEGNFFEKLKPFLSKNKKTLVIAETLTSYLNEEEHNHLVKSIEKLLGKFKESAYLSHESNKMLSGVLGKLLLFYRDRVAKTRSYKHFKGKEEIRKYFEGRGFKVIRLSESKRTNNFFYLVS
jgi:O-methyltransferase involved in polyketide biosynthesis